MAAMYVAMLLTDWQIIKHTPDPSDPGEGDETIYVRFTTCSGHAWSSLYSILIDWSLGCRHVDAYCLQLDQRNSLFVEFVGPSCDA